MANGEKIEHIEFFLMNSIIPFSPQELNDEHTLKVWLFLHSLYSELSRCSSFFGLLWVFGWVLGRIRGFAVELNFVCGPGILLTLVCYIVERLSPVVKLILISWRNWGFGWVFRLGLLSGTSLT